MEIGSERLRSRAWTPDDIPDQRGRVAVVTGANSGLGLETARELARKGAHVVMAVRNQDRADRARRAITADVAGADLEMSELDLASLGSVRACADAVLADHPRIDLLVNNAGIMGIPRRTTADGFEMQLGVNHLGHFVLTARLLPALVRAPAARIISVTSFARYIGRPVNPDDPHLERVYDPWVSYGRSKLANLHFGIELQRRLETAGARVSSLVADPGFSHTDLQAASVRMTGGGLLQRFWHASVQAVGTSAGHGALPQLRAATDPDVSGGELYAPRWRIAGPPVRRRALYPSHRDARRTLWEVSERETREPFDVAGTVRGAASSSQEARRSDEP